MDLEVYAIVHCGGKGRLNYPASNGSPTDRCQQLHNIAVHETIKHEDSYALGRIHVNHVENAWSLFKPGLHGVYHFVSAKYLQDYLDEFAFRGSHRSEREAMVDLVLACC